MIDPGAPVAHRLVPSSGSTAISTSGTSVPSGNSAPTFSPMYSMGASSRSPSPITMVPRMGIESMVLRMASVATWSAELALALPHRPGGSDRGHLHDAQKARSQIAFNVFPVSAGFAFRTSLRGHIFLPGTKL